MLCKSCRCKQNQKNVGKSTEEDRYDKEKCFQCGNLCVNLNRICDGVIDCLGTGEDEKFCQSVTKRSKIKLNIQNIIFYIFNLETKIYFT